MRLPLLTRMLLLVVALLGIFVMLGFFSIMKSLSALEQPKLTQRQEGVGIGPAPLAVTDLKSSAVLRKG